MLNWAHLSEPRRNADIGSAIGRKPTQNARALMFPPLQAVALPLLPTAGLAAFALYPPVARNPRLLWSFLGVSAILFLWNLALLAAAVRKRRALALEVVLRAQHYVQACAHTSIFLYLGMVLAPGLRICLPHHRAAAVCVCLRHPAQLVATRHLHARLRTVPDHLQHEPVPVVQGGLVLSAVCHDRRRLRREGIHPLEQGQPAGAHLQSVLVHADDFFFLPACGRRQRHHLGSGDCDDTVLSAAHVRVLVSGRAARTGSLRRDDDDDDGGGDDVCVRPRLLRRDRHLLLLRFLYSDCGLSRHAPALHRSVHGAADGAWAHDFRRALWAQHHRAVRTAWRRRPPDLLRQASPGSVSEPGDQMDRPNGSIRPAAAVRSSRDRTSAVAMAP